MTKLTRYKGNEREYFFIIFLDLVSIKPVETLVLLV